MANYHKGKFKPRFPEKYKGNPTRIVYRSLWELQVMKYLDEHGDVIRWASEEHVILYRSPLDNKVHRYFVDFWVELKKPGGVATQIIEVKPMNQITEPDKTKKKTKRFITEVTTYAVNRAKWKAAHIVAQREGWEFLVMTKTKDGKFRMLDAKELKLDE